MTSRQMKGKWLAGISHVDFVSLRETQIGRSGGHPSASGNTARIFPASAERPDEVDAGL